MRKPVNPVPEQTESSTATTLVGTYDLRAAPTQSPFILFKASLPAQYRVEQAICFRGRAGFIAGNVKSQEQLVIRVRQLGEGAVEARFLVVWNRTEGRVNLPHIKLTPHDPPDSPMLQWSFWQGCHVGGGLYHDVFDVTHFAELELHDA